MQFTSKNLALLAAAASFTNALPTKVAKRSFDASANNNVAVWWGNAPTLTPLSTICKSSSQDIVILTFGEYASGKWTQVGNVASADDIKACQSAGKKVFMSLGGGTGTISFTSDDDAKKAADAAYSAFLQDSGVMGAALDGIDLDLENRAPAHWDAFVTEIRTKMSKDQYLSAAPQCPRPDASIPDDVLNMLDFVWVQFYNNGDCNHGASGFDASVKAWSEALTKPKFYIAGPGSSASAGSGYIDAGALAKEVADVQGMKLSNFGGYAFWDASTAASNGDYAGAAKKALGGNTGSSGSSSPSSAAASSPAAAKTSAAKTSAAPAQTSAAGRNGQGSDGTQTVQATSTAHVTSTAFATGSAPAATATDDATGSTDAPTSAAAAPAGPTATGSSGSSSGTSCTQDGSIVCSADGKQFGVCSGGSAVMMAVSAGTTCSGGQINASS